MKVFTQDMHLVIDGEPYDTLIGAQVPKRFEKWFEENCMHFVEEVKAPPRPKEDGGKKSPDDKMANTLGMNKK